MSNASVPCRPSVLLVEDDAPTCSRLARAIATHEGFTLAGTCTTLAEAEAAVARDAPTVLLTDIGLPDGSGIDLIRRVRASAAATQIMAITVLGDEGTVMRAIEAGATGYLLKDSSSRSIGDAILELLEGGSPMSPPIARMLLRRVAGGGAARGPGPPAESASPAGGKPQGDEAPLLTHREQEILGLFAKGFTFPEIARLLGISPHTVTTHVRHIYEKLEVRSRGEAVFEAVQKGILRLSD
jgi:DNA-binding NarL/FixJ family response regulator